MNEPIDASQLNMALTSIRESLDTIHVKALSSYSSRSLSGEGFIRGPEIVKTISDIKKVLDACNEKSTIEQFHSLNASVNGLLSDLENWDMRGGERYSPDLKTANDNLLAILPPMADNKSEEPQSPDDDEERQMFMP